MEQWLERSHPTNVSCVRLPDPALNGFAVGSLLCSERFFSGYSGFPSPQKPTFPFDPGMHGHF